MDYGETIANVVTAFQSGNISYIRSVYSKSTSQGAQGQLIRQTIDHMVPVYRPGYTSLKDLAADMDAKEMATMYPSERLAKRLESKYQAGLFLERVLPSLSNFNDGKYLYLAITHCDPEHYKSLSKLYLKKEAIYDYINECVMNDAVYPYRVLISHYKNLKQCIPGPEYQRNAPSIRGWNKTLMKGVVSFLLDLDIDDKRKHDFMSELHDQDFKGHNLQNTVAKLIDNLKSEFMVEAAEYVSELNLKDVFIELHEDTQYALLHWRLQRSASLRERFQHKGELKYGGVTLTVKEYKKYF